MIRRWRLLITLALLLLLVASLLHPGVHWRVIGWWRGEAFYEGRPTSYWREQVRRIPISYAEIVELQESSPSWPELLLERLSGNPPDRFPTQRLRDPTAIPILEELIRDPDPRIRESARELYLSALILRKHLME